MPTATDIGTTTPRPVKPRNDIERRLQRQSRARRRAYLKYIETREALDASIAEAAEQSVPWLRIEKLTGIQRARAKELARRARRENV